MIRGTTPTHYFDIKNNEINTSMLGKINVLYGQNDKLLFKKKTEDCKLENNTIITKLTREESLKFDHKQPAQVQIVVETKNGDIIETVVMTIGVDKLLDDGELE